MKHESCRQRIDAWLSGAIDEVLWNQHLTQCDHCRLEVEGYRALFSVLCEESEVEPSRSLDRIVRAAMPEPKQVLRPGLAVGVGAAAWLAALAAVGMGSSAAGLGEDGMGIALGLLAVYAMITAVTAVPLLIRRTAMASTE